MRSRLFPLVAVFCTLGVLALSAAPVMAQEFGNRYIKETSGNYRIGAPNLGNLQPVTETVGGRLFSFNTGGITSCPYAGSCGTLTFVADTSFCLAAAGNTGDVFVATCNANGTVWVELYENDASHIRWLNRLADQSGYYATLSGHNNGGFMFLDSWQTPGDYQRFKLQAP